MGVFMVYLLSAGMGIIPFCCCFVDTEFLHFMSRGGKAERLRFCDPFEGQIIFV